MEEGGDKNHSLTGLRSRDDLFFGRESVRDTRGQVPRFPEFLDVPLRGGGSHPLALRARSGHGWKGWAVGKIEAWALELEDGKAEEGRRRGVKDGSLSAYIGNEYQTPPTSLKTRLFPRGHANGTVGLPKPVLMKMPQ